MAPPLRLLVGALPGKEHAAYLERVRDLLAPLSLTFGFQLDGLLIRSLPDGSGRGQFSSLDGEETALATFNRPLDGEVLALVFRVLMRAVLGTGQRVILVDKIDGLALWSSQLREIAEKLLAHADPELHVLATWFPPDTGPRAELRSELQMFPSTETQVLEPGDAAGAAAQAAQRFLFAFGDPGTAGPLPDMTRRAELAVVQAEPRPVVREAPRATEEDKDDKEPPPPRRPAMEFYFLDESEVEFNREEEDAEADAEAKWPQTRTSAGLRPAPQAQREEDHRRPPRPLTVGWLGRNSSLGCKPDAVREQALPAAEENGRVSCCGALWVVNGGGSEEAYIVKRSREATHDSDLAPLDREFRFYTELVPREEALFTDAMRVPRCIAANILPRGSCEANVRSASFLLVLERFCSPAWTSWDPTVGCSDAQAIASVEVLAQLHAFFEDDTKLAPLSWVPAVASSQAIFSKTWKIAGAICESLLGPVALEMGQRLSDGGLARALAMVLRPPVTLLHGDFKPENLRFSTAAEQCPSVAAFDWGNLARGRGAYDFVYFSVLSGPPKQRFARHSILLERYSEAYQRASPGGSGPPSAFEDDVRAATCIIFCNHLVRMMSPHLQAESMQRILRRRLEWLGGAMRDLRVDKVMS